MGPTLRRAARRQPPHSPWSGPSVSTMRASAFGVATRNGPILAGVSSEQVGLDAAGTLAVCAAVGVGAVIISDLAARRLPLPAVVLEIVGGILVGPDVLGLADDNVIVSAFSELGLLMLMFLAGYEIQVDRIKGSPLRSAV